LGLSVNELKNKKTSGFVFVKENLRFYFRNFDDDDDDGPICTLFVVPPVVIVNGDAFS
jgi:hypothetical protein